MFGTVASVNGSTTAGACGLAGTAGTFTLTAFHGTTDTVGVSPTTTFSEHGVTAPSFANVCVGEKVGAVGTISSATVTATGVFMTPPPMPKPPLPKPQGVFGIVASVNGSTTAGACGLAGTAGTFTLAAFHGTTDTVDVSPTTTFSEHGVTAPSFANVCVGREGGRGRHHLERHRHRHGRVHDPTADAQAATPEAAGRVRDRGIGQRVHHGRGMRARRHRRKLFTLTAFHAPPTPWA